MNKWDIRHLQTKILGSRYIRDEASSVLTPGWQQGSAGVQQSGDTRTPHMAQGQAQMWDYGDIGTLQLAPYWGSFQILCYSEEFFVLFIEYKKDPFTHMC